MEAETRLEAAVNLVIDKIIDDTGIAIKQPPLRDSGDCTVRVSGEREIWQSMNRKHAEREVTLALYSKADEAADGVNVIGRIQDYISLMNDMPGSDVVNICGVSTVEAAEDNISEEWIYRMSIIIKYCY